MEKRPIRDGERHGQAEGVAGEGGEGRRPGTDFTAALLLCVLCLDFSLSAELTVGSLVLLRVSLGEVMVFGVGCSEAESEREV